MKTLARSRSRVSGPVTPKSRIPENGPARTARAAASSGPLDADLLRKMDAWWRAANYLSVGQT